MTDLEEHYNNIFEELNPDTKDFVIDLITNQPKDFTAYFTYNGLNHIQYTNKKYYVNFINDLKKTKLYIDDTASGYRLLEHIEENPDAYYEFILSFNRPVMLFFRHLLNYSSESLSRNYSPEL